MSDGERRNSPERTVMTSTMPDENTEMSTLQTTATTAASPIADSIENVSASAQLNEDKPLSKNQLRKQRRREHAAQMRVMRKEKRRDERRQRRLRQQQQNANVVDDTDKVNKDVSSSEDQAVSAPCVVPRAKRQKQNEKEIILRNMTVVIDMAFDDLMRETVSWHLIILILSIHQCGTYIFADGIGNCQSVRTSDTMLFVQ